MEHSTQKRKHKEEERRGRTDGARRRVVGEGEHVHEDVVRLVWCERGTRRRGNAARRTRFDSRRCAPRCTNVARPAPPRAAPCRRPRIAPHTDTHGRTSPSERPAPSTPLPSPPLPSAPSNPQHPTTPSPRTRTSRSAALAVLLLPTVVGRGRDLDRRALPGAVRQRRVCLELLLRDDLVDFCAGVRACVRAGGGGCVDEQVGGGGGARGVSGRKGSVGGGASA